MYTYTIHNMRAVGMHHHGPRELLLHGRYHLQWEPDNPKDLGNAVAIHDWSNQRRAYLTRDDAKVMSYLLYGKCAAGRVECVPQTEAHVVSYDLGPQHECTVKFSAEPKEHGFICVVLSKGKCKFDFKQQ